MLSAPRQDWSTYEAMVRPYDQALLHGLTPQQRFEMYADLFGFVMNARHGRGDWARLESWRRQLKTETRLRVVRALHQLDRLHHGKFAAKDTR